MKKSLASRRGKREFDIVVFGATGVAGAATARYLADLAPQGVSVALAGRNRAKLEQVRRSLPDRAADWTLIEADAGSPASTDAMATRTRVVMTTVGPWLRYGENLVASAVNAGTHYLDLTAETPFVRWSIDKFHDQAAQNGTRIIHSCGFDSVPSDVTAYLLHRAAADDGEGTLGDTTMILRQIWGWVSGGSVDSFRVIAGLVGNRPQLRQVLDPDALTNNPGESRPRPKQPFDGRIINAARVDPSLRGTLAPFPVSIYNTRIVRRTNALLGDAYGPDFRYGEGIGLVRLPIVSTVVAGAVVLGCAVAFASMATPPIRRALDIVLPKPGTGPSDKTMDRGYLGVETYTRTSTDARYVATFKLTGDPGYKGTAVMFAECALGLVLDADRLPVRAGVLTPVAALGDVLVDRLRAAGVTLECARSDNDMTTSDMRA
ncbi:MULTISPECIES: saccharopine dehydrogenase NADP-binding domain-containing protein [unclassified Mycobacterium]|uniref:saccharopine dehydrogenase family protein n=1 Tax=unclassified Mycobacterium TaxID=2642494 RepID=UPI00073FD51E|nr:MULTISPECIES: saccharopine dehydrogenase NADP-binding domain-containing protein [unclassified Mycobacterium]KUH82392.1 enoyl-ACP reductase [Mycobacterium sp. GA-0227b]KUH88935.1 enoyl-ACP reductase [Mycobacterium sp. GA-1999]